MKNMFFEVRRAAKKDIEAIRILAKKSFNTYAKNAEITEMVVPFEETYDDVLKAIENTNVYVALASEEVIGSVRVEIKNDNTAYLTRFGVCEEHQNNGIGKILMNSVDELMEELGVTNLYLHTSSRMFSLIRFYYGRCFYIKSTNNDRGYIRALLCKEYEPVTVEKTDDKLTCDSAVI